MMVSCMCEKFMKALRRDLTLLKMTLLHRIKLASIEIAKIDTARIKLDSIDIAKIDTARIKLAPIGIATT